MSRHRNPWPKIGYDAWMLGLEASSVIGLRLLKIAGGGAAAEAEARRMASEKLGAAMDLQGKLLTGGLGLDSAGAARQTLTHYRRRVRANRRRLSK